MAHSAFFMDHLDPMFGPCNLLMGHIWCSTTCNKNIFDEFNLAKYMAMKKAMYLYSRFHKLKPAGETKLM
jgi:hypothetical protein